MESKPKPLFYVAVFVVVAGLLGFAFYRGWVIPRGAQQGPGQIDPKELGAGAEAPDATGITTVKEWVRKDSEMLPEPKGTAAYKPLKDNTVRFALNVWAGWSPIILANNGFKADKVWKTPDGKDFKVELVLIDDPVAMRDAYSIGDVHIGWATLDMMPLLMQGFVDKEGKPRDSRVMPRIYQQVDWSNGGDGIVVREEIKSVADLRDKQIVLAQNSPSHYFALNMLVAGGVQPSEAKWFFTADAFQAAAAFNGDKKLAAAVSWAPDIYNLEKVRGNKMLVTTATANKLIADIWFARADFAKDHPGIVEGLVRGIFDAMVELKNEDKKKECAQLMSAGYNIPAGDTLGMLADAHSTNWAENYQFFLNQNNPANFERVWRQAYYLYHRIGSIKHTPVPFHQVMDPSIIAKLGEEKKYSSQTDEYTVKFAPISSKELVEQSPILTNTVIIHFFPNSSEIYKKITRQRDGKDIEELYDPKVDLILDQIAELSGKFGAARIIIEGHTDNSMQGKAPADLVKQLSLDRANAVKEALVNKFKKLDPNQFNVEGRGWDQPAEPEDRYNHAKNRRVEIKIYPAEAH